MTANPCFENAIPGSPSRNGNLAEWRASFVEDQCFRLQTADLQKLLILSFDIQGRGKSVSCCCFATARGGPCSRGWAMRKWPKLHKQTFFQRSDASFQTKGGHRSYMLDILTCIYIYIRIFVRIHIHMTLYQFWIQYLSRHANSALLPFGIQLLVC